MAKTKTKPAAVMVAQPDIDHGSLSIIRDKLNTSENIQAVAQRYQIDEDRAKMAIGNVLTVIFNADETTNLQKCSASSIMTAIKDSAMLGLYVDNRQHAHLVARWNDKKKHHEAKLQIGYRGYIYKLRQKLSDVDVQVYIVEKPEDFSFTSKDGVAFYEYSPTNPFFSDYMKATGAFCYISYSVNGIQKSVIEALPHSEILKIKAVAKTTKFWDQWAGEKIKVAAIRRACKHRFASIVEDLDAFDNEDYDLDAKSVAATAQSGITATSEQLKRALAKDDEDEGKPFVTEAAFVEVSLGKRSELEDPASGTASTAEREPDQGAEVSVEPLAEPLPQTKEVVPVADEAVSDLPAYLGSDFIKSYVIAPTAEWDGSTICIGEFVVNKVWKSPKQAYSYLVEKTMSMPEDLRINVALNNAAFLAYLWPTAKQMVISYLEGIGLAVAPQMKEGGHA